MNYRGSIACLLALLFFAVSLYGQSPIELKADALYECGQYDLASKLYLQSVRANTEDNISKQTLARLADSHRRAGQHDLAFSYYKDALRADRKNPALLLEYAQVAMTQGDYKLAVKTLEDYQKKAPNDPRTQAFIDWCSNINLHLDADDDFKVSLLPISSRMNDVSPVILQRGLVYVSDRPSTTKGGVSAINEKQIFYSEPASTSKWSNPMVFAGQEERSSLSSSINFAEDGNVLYFNVFEESEVGVKRKFVDKAFVSKLKNGIWSTPQEVSFNSSNNRYSVKHLAATADNNTVYFSSDMAGGYGGFDLYVVHRGEDGSWLPVKNLGPVINTKGDEVYPTIHADETLYFSTDGHGGIGGLDIFSTKCHRDGRWSAPQHMAVPINSARDDHSLCMEFDKELGYLSSNRPGGKGGFDIYQLNVSSKKARKMLDAENLKLENIVNKEEIFHEDELFKDGLVPVSNRIDESMSEEVKYMEFDLTYLNEKSSEELTFYIIGRLMDNQTKDNISEESIILRDLDTGKESTYQTKSDGNFFFELVPNREYVVYVKRGDHVSDYQGISTFDRSKSQILHVVLLSFNDENTLLKKNREFDRMFGAEPIVKTKEKVVDEFITHKQKLAGPVTNRKEIKPVAKEKNQKEEVRTWEPRSKEVSESAIPKSSRGADAVRRGVVIKIEVGSFFDQVDKDRRFIRKLNGNYEVEDDNGIYRYLSGKYDNLQDAAVYMNYLRSIGYKSAFLVVYKNGKRMNMNYQEALRLLDEQVK